MYLKYVNGSNALLNSILWEYVLKNDEKRENYPPTRVKVIHEFTKVRLSLINLCFA